MTNNSAKQDLERLQCRLAELGPVAVAVSGGVDSMTLATVAHRVNPRCQMYHAVSPAVPQAATDRVKRYARQEGWQLHIVNAREIEDKDYRRNPVNRCYFCKTNLYSTLDIQSDLTIVSGTNTDDLGDYRPGLIAAEEHGVAHPFVDARISKNQLRAIAKYLGLHDLHELPAAPCLSSRVTTGIAIDEKLLPVIDSVETQIWQYFEKQLALAAVRCRILRDSVSIQLQGRIDFEKADSEFSKIKALVRDAFNESGFMQFEKIIIEPYKKGSAFIRDDASEKVINAINL